MNITFGICLSPNYNLKFLYNLIQSIVNQNIEKYEIIVIGQLSQNDLDKFSPHIKYIPFDEDVKAGWITKKKNIIANEAQYEYVCIVHDYYKFGVDWYKSLIKDTTKKDIIMSRIINENNDTRGPDWVLNPFLMKTFLEKNVTFNRKLVDLFPFETPMYVVGLNYDTKNCGKYQYISGGFIFCKKDILLDCPLNDAYVWGQAEDVDWSERLMKKYSDQLSMVQDSIVYIQKPDKWKVYQLPDDVLLEFKKFYDHDYNRIMFHE